eukprot:4388646-Prymnesium_polylepis.1
MVSRKKLYEPFFPRDCLKFGAAATMLPYPAYLVPTLCIGALRTARPTLQAGRPVLQAAARHHRYLSMSHARLVVAQRNVAPAGDDGLASLAA